MSAPAAPCRSSVVASRTYAILSGLVGRYDFGSTPTQVLVKPGLVLAGEHCMSPAALLTGISAWATAELNGPTTKRTWGSFTRVPKFLAPWFGLFCPLTASSCWLIVIVKPGTWILARARATPFAVGTPFGASPPVIGSSIPILTAMLPAAALAGAAALAAALAGAAALAATLGAAAALG